MDYFLFNFSGVQFHYTMSQHFLEYPYKERAAVKKIIMDLSTLFRSVAKSMFPEAKIVADKFHVIRVVITLENASRKNFMQQKGNGSSEVVIFCLSRNTN